MTQRHNSLRAGPPMRNAYKVAFKINWKKKGKKGGGKEE